MKIGDLKAGDTVRFLPPDANGNPNDLRCEVGVVTVAHVGAVTCKFGNIVRQFFAAGTSTAQSQDEVACLQLVHSRPSGTDAVDTPAAQKEGKIAMRKIYKYPLEMIAIQDIKMPEKAKILSVQLQGEQLCLWAEVDPIAKPDIYPIKIFGTGHEVKHDCGRLEHVSTVQQGPMVWHVYQVLSREY